MSLLLFTETVKMTNAVSFWSNLKNHQHHGYHEEDVHSNSNNNSNKLAKRRVTSLFADALQDGTCLGPFDQSCWKRQADCCKDCTHCLDTRTKERVCSFPRGGHLHDHDAAILATTPYGLPLNSWKVIFQTLLTAMNVLCWLIPLKSKKISQNKFALSMANAFSGGVFLSLAFGHLIPESVHGFANLPEETPYLLVLAGYLLIFFVEKVAFDAHEILHEMQGDSGHSHNHHHVATNSDHKEKEVAPASSGRGAVILLGALAVHSVLEMMALGLANNFGDCALLTLSISLHQPAESIALLVAFLKSGMSEQQVIKYLSIFSCMGPIGVALGMAVSEYAAPIVDSIMLAVVAGTFVYVGATEVIPEEWEDGQHKWAKFAALMGGIGSILAITQYTASLGGHSH